MALEEGTEQETGKNQSLDKGGNDLLLQLQKQVVELQNQLSERPAEIPATFNGMNKEQFQMFMDVMTETKRKELDWELGVDEEQVPKEDWVEGGVNFCVPSTGYALSCDRRKGQIVRLPYNKKVIFFEHQGTRKIEQGKFSSVAPIAVYTSESKKEIQWIREHSMYGILIYENSKDVMTADMHKIQKLSRIIGVLKNYDYLDLLKRAKEHNLQPSDDANELRFRIAHCMAEKELESEGIKTAAMLNISEKEKLLTEAKSIDK